MFEIYSAQASQTADRISLAGALDLVHQLPSPEPTLRHRLLHWLAERLQRQSRRTVPVPVAFR